MFGSLKSNNKSQQRRHNVVNKTIKSPRSQTIRLSGKQPSLDDECDKMPELDDSVTSLSNYHSTEEEITRSAKPRGNTMHACCICNLSGKKMQSRSMECQRCQTTFCRDCVNIGAKERTLINGRNDIFWLCTDCVNSVKTNWMVEKDKEETLHLDSILSEMKQKLDNLETELKNKIDKDTSRNIAKEVFVESVNKSETVKQSGFITSRGEVGNITPDASTACMTYADAAKQIVKEVLEVKTKTEESIEERKLNILVFNMNESTASSKEDQRIDDMGTFRDICNACDMPVPQSDIVKITRLGSPKADRKPRATMVTVKKEETKRALFRNLYKLKETENKQYEQIAMSHDMTFEEKENNRKLLDVANKKRNEEPSENYTFVVRGPPWNRYIQRVRKRQQNTIIKTTFMPELSDQQPGVEQSA